MGRLRDQVLDTVDAMASTEGGARNNSGASVDPLTTSQLLVLSEREPTVKAVLGDRYARSLDYLIHEQLPEGHWARPDDTWHSSISAWALAALAPARPTASESLDAGLRWLALRELPDGGVSQSETLEEPNTYSTGCTIRALKALDVPQQRVRRHVDWLMTRQASNGGFTDNCVVQKAPEPSISAYVWHALEDCPVHGADIIKRGIEEFVASTQRPSGAWTTWFENEDTLEGTAACLRVLGGAARSYPEPLRKGLAYVRSVRLEIQEWWAVLSLGYLLKPLAELS
jgi:prenyltransferase beta subunit